MTVTWDQVHVGDKLRGQDGALWPVVERTPGSRWVSAGAHDDFTMQLGDRSVTVTKRLIDPAPVAERADHSAMGAAWQALADQGFHLTLIGESMSADEFGDPVVRGKGATRDDGIRFDRYGRYLMPHPVTGEETSFTRVTTLAKALADTYGLNLWAKRMTAKGMSIRPDLVALAASADVDKDKSTLNEIVEKAEAAAEADKGANYGSAFHKFAERLDRGETLATMRVPAPLDKDVQGYAEALRSRSLRVMPDYMERVVCIPDLGACGTLDRIVSQPPGPTHSHPHAILDLKSAKEDSIGYAWMEIAIQQACYANATHMWDGVNKCWIEMPSVDMARALIAHSPIGIGHTEIYGVDLIKGWKLAQACVMVRAWRKDTYSWLVAPDNPTAVALHLVSQAASREALAALWERYHPQGIWTDDVMAAAQQRLAALDNR